MRWLIGALLLASEGSATAQPAAPVSPVPPMTPALTQATQLLELGDFEKALQRLDAALRSTAAPAEQAQLHLTRGRCLLALSKRAQALAAFTLALEQDVGLEPGDWASPDVVDLFEEARASFPGTLVVNVKGEAAVRVDARNLGPAPLTTQLRHGEHLVEAVAPDGRRGRQTVQVRAGRGAEVTLELSEAAPQPTAGSSVTTDAPTVGRPPGPTPSRAPAVTTVIGGSVLVLGGAVGLGWALSVWSRAQAQRVDQSPMTQPQVTAAEFDAARTAYVVSLVALGVGAATAAVGGWLLARAPSSVTVGLAPIAGGHVLFACGDFW